MLSRVAVGLAIALAAGTAHAERVVAIAPLTTLEAEDTSASTKKLTAQLEAAVTALGGNKIITAAQVADAIKKAKKPNLKVCEGESACLAELGKLVGAQVVIAGQVGGLGESKVVYLNATDVAAAKELRSTTLAIGGKDDAVAPTGAVIRLLDPDKYRGQVHFAIDTPGTTVYVNGSKVALTGKGELALPVGTQAVRITHPQYRDFVRFVDVQFGRATDVSVGMTQYPIVHRDIQGNPINRDKIEYVDPPFWRRWYVVGAGAAVVFVASSIIFFNLSRDLPDAPCREVGGAKC